MLVALLSAKGSPGVTTAALCLAAQAGPAALVVEVDPAGGDLECWATPRRGLHQEAGLVGLATGVGPRVSDAELRGYAVEVVPGVAAITAPTSWSAMSAVLARCGDRLGSVLALGGGLVFADLGRWLPSAPLGGLLWAADAVLVVCRPTLESIEHARGLVAPGGPVDGAPGAVGVVVVGGPYGPAEIADALRVPVVGLLPWDPSAVVALVEHGTGRAWQRAALAAAAAESCTVIQSLRGAGTAVGGHG
jgi:MinD-like ATPase involved in chromosome partitioning or flagellar assembly